MRLSPQHFQSTDQELANRSLHAGLALGSVHRRHVTEAVLGKELS